MSRPRTVDRELAERVGRETEKYLRLYCDRGISQLAMKCLENELTRRRESYLRGLGK